MFKYIKRRCPDICKGDRNLVFQKENADQKVKNTSLPFNNEQSK